MEQDVEVVFGSTTGNSSQSGAASTDRNAAEEEEEEAAVAAARRQIIGVGRRLRRLRRRGSEQERERMVAAAAAAAAAAAVPSNHCSRRTRTRTPGVIQGICGPSKHDFRPKTTVELQDEHTYEHCGSSYCITKVANLEVHISWETIFK